MDSNIRGQNGTCLPPFPEKALQYSGPVRVPVRNHAKAVSMKQRSNRFLTAVGRQPMASLLLLGLLWIAGVTAGFQQAERIAARRVDLLLDSSRDALKELLDSLIVSPLLVPEILARSRTVRALLSRPNPVAVREQNENLEEVVQGVSLDAIYVMDRQGDTLAASNWRAPDSFVGQNYQFRPYFQQAISGGTGRYTATGAPSLKLGVYLARPVTVDGRIRGAVVAKISLDPMRTRVDELWRQEREMVLVADANGVVILSPVSALAFKAVQPLPRAVLKTIETSRQYDDREIVPAAVTAGNSLDNDLRFVDFKEIPGASFLQKSYHFSDLGLRLYLHLPAARYWTTVAEFTAMFSLLALVIGLVVMGVVQRWVYADKLFETAIRDPLTGLNTRLYMGEWCDAAIKEHNRDPQAGIGLAVFDLDRFKQINDKHGHLAGDDVLRRVGEIIRNAIRGADLAVRFGGEELAVFVRCADAAVAVALADRIRHSVEQTEFRSKTGRMPVTLSGGVAYRADGESLDALFARADKKLYEAKELGRNRVCS